MRIPTKLAIIAALMLLLAIPLFLVVSKIYERDNYHEQARVDIASSWAGEQLVVGPILVVPYTRSYEKQEFNKELERYVASNVTVDEQLLVLPSTLTGNVELQTEIRKRGIYEIPVYNSAINLGGEISNSEILELALREDIVAIARPFLSVVVNDTRGIAASPALRWNGSVVEFKPGSQLTFGSAGVHVPLNDVDLAALNSYQFSVSFTLRGTSSFRLAPLGDSSSIDISSSWPHPRFEGLYLPSHREISDSGFTASWQVSAFATNNAEKAHDCARGSCGQLMSNSLGVALVDPVDVYLQAQRASKYGILFIGLTFTAFFLFEVLRKVAIHPIQYALVGLALSVFYLLLVSLAEHIPFLFAYGIATLACSGLLGFYITYVLKSVMRGGLFAAAIAGLYAILYVIIQEEDYAFSMGAGLVFIALSGVMFATRNTDWFKVSKHAFKEAETKVGKM